MSILIFLALVVGVVALARFGLIPSDQINPNAGPSGQAFWASLLMLLAAAVASALSYLRESQTQVSLAIARNIALALAGVALLAILLVGCAQPAPADPNSEVMAGEGTVSAPSGWTAYCARTENFADPAC